MREPKGLNYGVGDHDHEDYSEQSTCSTQLSNIIDCTKRAKLAGYGT
jgi:hypothetical protein